MGYWKQRMLDMWERGYSSSSKTVCAECVTDPVLQDRIGGALDEGPCSFCAADESADFEVVLEALSDAILAEYTDPANELPYESAEGGYQGTVYDGREVVEQLDIWTDRDDVLEEAASCFAGSAWCERDFFSLKPFETYRYGWEGFVDKIKHVTRFLFLVDDDGEEERHDEIKPKHMLDALGDLLREHGTITTVTPEHEIFRARIHNDRETVATAAELGPPPRELARLSNRMSPAGIPMFYGARDRDTAVAETLNWTRLNGVKITMASFRPTRPLRLVDLTQLPTAPSQFEEELHHLRGPIHFVHAFVREMTKPVARDGYEHVDYVPTQVVTEYLRYRFRTADDEPVDGLIYDSSRLSGGVALVLFVDGSDCGPRERERWQGEPSLLLQGHTVHSPDDFAYLWGHIT